MPATVSLVEQLHGLLEHVGVVAHCAIESVADHVILRVGDVY